MAAADKVMPPRLVQLLRPHRGEVACLDAALDWLATAGADRTLRLWRWQSGAGWTERAVVEAVHRHGVTAVRWAAGGVLLVSGGVDGAARLWGRELSPQRRLMAPGAAAVRALCWAGGCARLVVGHDDGALCVWSAHAGELVARMRPHEDSLRAVAMPARDVLLLTACADGVLKVFDFAGDEVGPAPLLWEDAAHDLGVVCADASENGAAASGGQDGRVRLWRASEGSLKAWGLPLEGHSAAVTDVRWALTGDVLASASLDRTARLWVAGVGGCAHVLHAHQRYLTCVALSPDLRYMITGSNDRTVRVWSLGAFSLEDELRPACEALAHFGVGDLQGIEPPAETVAVAPIVRPESGSLMFLWSLEQAHGGAVNCVAASENLLATASSDGLVKIYRWEEQQVQAVLLHELHAHQYPALAVDFGSKGRILLSAGLDGCALLWDVQSGVQLRELSVNHAESGGGEAGGGGVRGARVSSHKPPLLLLATDDGVAPLWSLDNANPEPLHVYAGHSDAVTCCACSSDGRLLATGSAGGELRLHACPPTPRTLHHEPVAHDLGVQSCDFAARPEAVGVSIDEHMLATAGCDSLVKLWVASESSVRLVQQFPAHGGGVTCLRWGLSSMLASAGVDGWSRVWHVSGGGGTVRAIGEASTSGALAVAILTPAGMEGELLAVGTMGGGLSLWRVNDPGDVVEELEECPTVRLWSKRAVQRWLREYVTLPPAGETGQECSGLANDLIRRASELGLSGACLLDEPIPALLDRLGYGAETAGWNDELCAKLQSELKLLRTPQPSLATEERAPHALLCPLTHRLLREPVAAADGFTYERSSIAEWFLADDSSSSPMSGRPLSSRRLRPNLGARDLLHQYLRLS